MSDGTRSGTAVIPNMANFYGAVVLIAASLVALAISFYHPGNLGFFGPVLMPRAFAVVVLLAGAGAITGHLPIRNAQDFFGGAALIGLAVVAMLAAIDLPGMKGFAFGPGTAPRLFAVLLASLGGIVSFNGLVFDGPPLAKFYIRGPLFLTASVFCFAACIRPLGLVVASYATIMVSAGATNDVNWKETALWGIVLTAFCSVLFPYGLNLPMQLCPKFYVPYFCP
jgi:putative tricarboxylic transport membrane protein